MIVLKDGKIIVCNNKVYAGKNKLELTKDTVYTHPAEKQCNFQGAQIKYLYNGTVSANNILTSRYGSTTDMQCYIMTSSGLSTTGDQLTALRNAMNASGFISAEWTNISITTTFNSYTMAAHDIYYALYSSDSSRICGGTINTTIPFTRTMTFPGPYYTYHTGAGAFAPYASTYISGEKLVWNAGDGLSVSFNLRMWCVTA